MTCLIYHCGHISKSVAILTILPQKTDFSRQLTALETICMADEPIPKATSLTYRWIQDYSGPGEKGLRERWSKELGTSLTDKQWQKACIFAHQCSLSTRTQETAYKLLTHWYATPVRYHKDRGSLLHIWWQCSVLQPFWSELKKLVSLITDTKLKLYVMCCLLHVTEFPIRKYKYSLSKHLLNAAKALSISLFWKLNRMPTVQEWLYKISEICDMQETIAQSGDNVVRFYKTWSPWYIFKYSQAYSDHTNTS